MIDKDEMPIEEKPCNHMEYIQGHWDDTDSYVHGYWLDTVEDYNLMNDKCTQCGKLVPY